MGQRLFFKSLLTILLLIFGSQRSLWASSHLAIHSLDAFPSIIDDTSVYELELYLVNEDPTQPWENGINVLISVDGDDPTALISSYVPSSPVLPGDSVLISISEYSFDPVRFVGGGITHDIIVWPSRIGLTTIDSAETQVLFTHTSNQVSNHIGVYCSTGFPPVIVDGIDYSMVFEVRNLDPVNYLFDPVSLYLSVNGDSGTAIAIDVPLTQALAPGASFEIDVPGYIFDSGRFTGGGITHDIIVWPMTLVVGQVDSFHTTVRHLTQTAFDMDNSSVSGFDFPIKPSQDYQLNLTAQNVGPQANSSDVDFYVQLDTYRPVLLGSKSEVILSDHSTSLAIPHFQLDALYPAIVNRKEFAYQSHTLRFWATESHIESWISQSTHYVPAAKQAASYPYAAGISFQHQVSVVPNPSTELTNLYITLDHQTDIQMQLFDLSGRQVMQQAWTAKIGDTELEISLTDLPNGIYLYQVTTDTDRFQGRIVKK